VLITRLVIWSAVVLGTLALLPALTQTVSMLVLAWMLVPLGYALQSAWFFQGMEQNVAPAAIIVGFRLATLGLTRLLVTTPEHYVRVPLIVGGAYAAAGVMMLAFAVSRHDIRIVPISPARIAELLHHGKAVFVGNIAVTLYRDANVLILGAFGTGAAVSVYAVAEKFVKAFQALVRPLNQFFFPRVVRQLGGSRRADGSAFRVVLRNTIPQLALLTSGGLVLGAGLVLLRRHLPDGLIRIGGGEIIRLVGLMAVSVLFGVGNFMFGVAGLNYLGRRRYLAQSILAVGLASVACCAILVRSFGATGAAVNFVLAEAVLFLLVARAYRA
jgi:PST family polysaccharide transporter